MSSLARARPSAPVLAAVLALLACSGGREVREVSGSASDGLIFALGDGAGRSDLYRARLPDGAVQPFLATPEHAETWPYWAEATRALVFQTEPERQGGGADLWLWRPGGQAPEPLAARPDRDERWPEWSSDGSRVVFAFAEPGARAAGLASSDIATGAERVVARSGPRDRFFRPSFDPGGSRVVAQRRGPDGRGSTIWIVDAGGPRRLTGEAGWFEQKPFFTRRGDAVVFSRQRDGAPRQLARADGSGSVTPLVASTPDADEHSARPSPTRDEVAYVSTRAGGRDVWLASLDGGAARNLTATPDRDEFAPRWSPDGERLVLTVGPAGPPGREGERLDWEGTRLVVIDREGRQLFETRGMMADWMPPF